MKYLFTAAVLITLIAGCASTQKPDSNYEIAQLALANFAGQDTIRLIQIPHTNISDRYRYGLVADDTIFKDAFVYRGNKIDHWSNNTFESARFGSEVKLIDDFTQVKKVSERAHIKRYISMSPPIFTNSGEFAVIVINTFSNSSFDASDDGSWICLQETKRQVGTV